MRTYPQIAELLAKIHGEQFGGRTDQRFLIGYEDLQHIRQGWNVDLDKLRKKVHKIGFDLIDVPECETQTFAVIETKTIRRWRRVPRRIIKAL